MPSAGDPSAMPLRGSFQRFGRFFKHRRGPVPASARPPTPARPPAAMPQPGGGGPARAEVARVAAVPLSRGGVVARATAAAQDDGERTSSERGSFVVDAESDVLDVDGLEPAWEGGDGGDGAEVAEEKETGAVREEEGERQKEKQMTERVQDQNAALEDGQVGDRGSSLDTLESGEGSREDEGEHNVEARIGEVDVIEARTDEVKVVEARTDEVDVVEACADEVDVIEARTDEVDVIEARTDEVDVIEVRTDEVHAVEVCTDAADAVRARTDGVDAVEERTDAVDAVQARTNEVHAVDKALEEGELLESDSWIDRVPASTTQDASDSPSYEHRPEAASSPAVSVSSVEDDSDVEWTVRSQQRAPRGSRFPNEERGRRLTRATLGRRQCCMSNCIDLAGETAIAPERTRLACLDADGKRRYLKEMLGTDGRFRFGENPVCSRFLMYALGFDYKTQGEVRGVRKMKTRRKRISPRKDEILGFLNDLAATEGLRKNGTSDVIVPYHTKQSVYDVYVALQRRLHGKDARKILCGVVYFGRLWKDHLGHILLQDETCTGRRGRPSREAARKAAVERDAFKVNEMSKHSTPRVDVRKGGAGTSGEFDSPQSVSPYPLRTASHGSANQFVSPLVLGVRNHSKCMQSLSVSPEQAMGTAKATVRVKSDAIFSRSRKRSRAEAGDNTDIVAEARPRSKSCVRTDVGVGVSDTCAASPPYEDGSSALRLMGKVRELEKEIMQREWREMLAAEDREVVRRALLIISSLAAGSP